MAMTRRDRTERSSDNSSDAKLSIALVDALKDPSSEVRHQAIRALGQRDDSRALDGLMGAHSKMRMPAFASKPRGLSVRSKAQDQQRRYVRRLKDSSASVRQQAAVGALDRIEDKIAVDALVDASADQKPICTSSGRVGVGSDRRSSSSAWSDQCVKRIPAIRCVSRLRGHWGKSKIRAPSTFDWRIKR